MDLRAEHRAASVMLENARDLGAANENRKLRRRSKNVASMMLLEKKEKWSSEGSVMLEK